MAKIPVSMVVNGAEVGPVEVDEYTSMLDFLQEYLNLTGTKLGCGIGVCRSCTIVVEGQDGALQPIRSCINNVGRFHGTKVTTIEGQAERNSDGALLKLSPVQQAFLRNYSFQCGWCTAGFVNGATALIDRLRREPVSANDVEQVIEEALGDHICRCTGYVRYFRAVREVIESTPGLLKEVE
ncbi:(2Fe-2S)-binding protein [Microbulbifer elongatus]|uniref:(2Fe-2S)-binding protein n=1 Tax=Microbulbifer elongatus TaxID=86173 RepID=UPI001E2FBC00|nr:(2Fe-2S)-binding protein [Microbulbifer elongatus]